MALVNPSKPSGLSPVRYLNGAKWDGKTRLYAIAAADTSSYFPGDLVAGNIAANDANTGLAGIALGTAGATALGVLVAVGPGTNSVGYSGQGGGAGGPMINPNNLAMTWRPAAAQSGVWYASVIDDPNVIFEIQESGASTNLTSAVIGLNANIVYAAPAAGVFVSGTTLNNATAPATTSTYNLKIMELAQRIDNHFSTSPTTGGAGQKWWVMINNHLYRTGTTGV